MEQLQHQQHWDSTKRCYYTVWRLFNDFFIRLDKKPRKWKDRLTFFVGYLVSDNKQSSTVRSYILVIKAVLQMNKIPINEDQYLLALLTKACRLRNNQLHTHLPIHKGMLKIILEKTDHYLMEANQLYLSLLYRTLFSTAYFSMFRVSELTLSEHQVHAWDVHVGTNKNKILFVLHTSKTHGWNMPPQMIKIQSTSSKWKHKRGEPATVASPNFCPYQLLREYAGERGSFSTDVEPFFIFWDKSPVTAYHFHSCLKAVLKFAGFNARYYSTHGLRAERSCDLYNLGLSVETIKKLGCWKLNAVFRYLRTWIIVGLHLPYSVPSITNYYPSIVADMVPAVFDLWILGDAFLTQVYHTLLDIVQKLLKVMILMCWLHIWLTTTTSMTAPDRIHLSTLQSHICWML